MNAFDGTIAALRDGSKATFLGGVVVAAVFAAVGAALFGATVVWWSPRSALRTIVALLGAAYVLYLLARSGERTGRVVTVAAWMIGAALLAVFADALGLFLVGHAVLVWLVRALYHQRSTIGALVDLGLTALALAAAVASMRSTGSLFLAIWCFFLTEALFAAVPNGPARALAAAGVKPPFERAERSANAALQRITRRGAP
jgi:hypothetical protein